MSLERVKELFVDYSNAFLRLKEALDLDVTENSVFLDGAIQRFEFTYEVAWKLVKQYLLYVGIEANSPRVVIKEAFAVHLINDGDEWIAMLEDRNKTTHIYNEDQAKAIYARVRDMHYKNLEHLKAKIGKEIDLYP